MSTAIVEKIKKLLRLARSANPHEAELAMQRAMKLAAEHQVEIEGLDLSGDANRTTHRDSDAMARLSYDRKYAALICQRFFRVRPVIRPTVRRGRDGWPVNVEKFAFVGTETDVEVGLYVYQFVYRHFAWCWRRHRGRCRNRYAFVTGIYHGLLSKLREAEPPAAARQAKGTELEISTDAYIAHHFGETTKHEMPDAKATAAHLAGFIQGRKTDINPAVKAAAPGPLQLTA